MSPARPPLQLDELKAIQTRFQRVFVLMCLLTIGLVVLIILRMGSPDPPEDPERITLWFTVFIASTMLTAQLYCLQRTNRDSRQRIEALTFMDSLTRTYNHRYLEMALPAEVKRAERHGRPLCLAYIDLDKFKPVNDRLGHAVGNRVLADLGRLFLASARESDIVGRVGGDEFLVILPETDLSGAHIFAERVRRRVASYVLAVSADVKVDTVRCSIGLAEYPGMEIEAEELRIQADEAMYRAKRAGGDRVST